MTEEPSLLSALSSRFSQRTSSVFLPSTSQSYRASMGDTSGRRGGGLAWHTVKFPFITVRADNIKGGGGRERDGRVQEDVDKVISSDNTFFFLESCPNSTPMGDHDVNKNTSNAICRMNWNVNALWGQVVEPPATLVPPLFASVSATLTETKSTVAIGSLVERQVNSIKVSRSKEAKEDDADLVAAPSLKNLGENYAIPPLGLLLKHPVSLLGVIPKEVSLFCAGAIAGATAKTVTAPLDRIKLLMQTHGLRAAGGVAKKGIGFLQAITLIGKEEGLRGYWKGNLPQVIRVIPYSAVQLFAYEFYKKLFKGKEVELHVVARLMAGACAGMTSTLVTYPLDVLRLRLAVEPGSISMSQVALKMLRSEGVGAFYAGLGPSLIGIAPYIAVNFCIFDLVKKSLPEKYKNRAESSIATALISATMATLMCYPLDTVRRQMQMRGSPFNSVLDAIPGIVERDGILGLYRGFVPNALKNLPNSSIRLTTFDTAKVMIAAGQKELQRIIEENKEKVEQ